MKQYRFITTYYDESGTAVTSTTITVPADSLLIARWKAHEHADRTRSANRWSRYHFWYLSTKEDTK